MRYTTVLSVLLLVLAIGLTDVEAQTVQYPDDNLSLVITLEGEPFDSTLFVFWYLEVDDPAPPDHDIFAHQIGTFREFEGAFWLDFLDIDAAGAFHFDLYVSLDGVNFDFVDEVVIAP
jgi:hypothetical protein